MLINKTDLENKTKKHRPVGVWTLTIFALFFGGIFPLYFEPFDLLRGYTAAYNSDDIPTIILVAVLNIAIIMASILAWKGSDIGRVSFLLLITVYFLRDGIRIFSWGTRIPNDIDSWLRYITDFGFPVLCFLYFNKTSTKEFFRKENMTSVANR
jgi:hypothetical protein